MTNNSLHETGADTVFDGLLEQSASLQGAIEKAIEGRNLAQWMRQHWANAARELSLLVELGRCEECTTRAATIERHGFGVFCFACNEKFTTCAACCGTVRKSAAVSDGAGHDVHSYCVGPNEDDMFDAVVR